MANVELSNEESAVFQNANFLLIKNKIIQKLQKTFGEIAQDYRRVTEVGNNQWITYCVTAPKISRGEQYNGLPYLMLDYPRSFSKMDTFAIRTFFWWGNYFSISLLLTGKSQKKLEENLLNNPILDNWHMDISSTPWNHQWEIDHSPVLASVNKDNYLPKDFFKLSKQIPLSQWQNMTPFFVMNFQELWNAINFQDA